MKLKKLFAFLTTGVIALSTMSVSVSAVDELVVPTENVEVLYNAPITADGVEFTPQHLGKGTDGAKLRFTYYSAEDKRAESTVIGIAGKANDDAWTWLQSEIDPGLTTEGYDVENVQEIYYDELVELADIGANVRRYVFCNWGLKADSDVKIELITPVVHYAEMTLFDGTLNDTELTPDELGKNIPGSKIRFTFTADVEKDWGAVSICGKEKGTWTWTSESKALLSAGVNVASTFKFSYADFVEYADIGDNLECFVFRDWGIAEDTNVKIELLVPAATLTDTTVKIPLFSGVLPYEGIYLTPAQLGKYVTDSKITITYTSDNPEGWSGIGICGNGSGDNWYTHSNHLFSIGEGETNVYTATYIEFVEFVGITEPISAYVFQNWGLEEDSTCTIELTIPVDPYEIETTLCDNTLKQGESITFTPQQLGQGINGARLVITYEAKDELNNNEAVMGIAGISKDGRWLQGKNIPSFIKKHNGTNVEELTYDEFVDLADINECDVNYYVFSNWSLKPNTNVKIKVIVPI